MLDVPLADPSVRNYRNRLLGKTRKQSACFCKINRRDSRRSGRVRQSISRIFFHDTHQPRQRFDSHCHGRHCFTRARSHHLISRTDRVDAASRIPRSRPDRRHHVAGEHGEEDAGDVTARTIINDHKSHSTRLQPVKGSIVRCRELDLHFALCVDRRRFSRNRHR